MLLLAIIHFSLLSYWQLSFHRFIRICDLACVFLRKVVRLRMCCVSFLLLKELFNIEWGSNGCSIQPTFQINCAGATIILGSRITFRFHYLWNLLHYIIYLNFISWNFFSFFSLELFTMMLCGLFIESTIEIFSWICMMHAEFLIWISRTTVKASDSDTIIMVIFLVLGVGGIFILFAVMALCYRFVLYRK